MANLARETGRAPLGGCRVLVLEDEYFLADDVAHALQALGAAIAGPVGEISAAMDVLDGDATLDGAVLDINLKGDMSFVVARALRAKDLPFVFTTGYARTTIAPEFQDVPTLEKAD